MISVLFVCLGNICRSPAAEGVLKQLVEKASVEDKVYVRSCGLGSWHVGSLPDMRMQEAARRRGILLASRAQQFHLDFFTKFDYILVSDHGVLKTLYKYAETPVQKAKLHLITAFSSSYKDQEIPDPYYGGDASFERVLDMLEDSSQGLLDHLRHQEKL